MRFRVLLALVLLLPGCAGPAEPAASEPPLPEEADPLVDLVVQADRMRRDEAGALHVLGEAWNPTGGPVIFVFVRVTLLDAEGKVVTERTSPTLRHVVPARERTPFDIVFTDAPDAVSHRVGVTAEAFDGTRHPQPSVFHVRRVDAAAGSHVAGTVRNDHERTAQTVRVLATFYDAAGDVVAVEAVAPSEVPLAPGATGTFETRPVPTGFASWNVTTQATYR